MQRSTPSPRRAYYPRTIAEPEIPATNFQLVHRFLGQTFARRFLIDRALGPPGHEPPPHNHLEINLDSHASMDIDLWVRAVGNHQVYTDWTSDDPEAHHTRVVLKAGRDVGIRVHSTGHQPLWVHIVAGKSHRVRVELPLSFHGSIALERPRSVVDISPMMCEALVIDGVQPTVSSRYTTDWETAESSKMRWSEDRADELFVSDRLGATVDQIANDRLCHKITISGDEYSAITLAYVGEDWSAPERGSAATGVTPAVTSWSINWSALGWYLFWLVVLLRLVYLY